MTMQRPAVEFALALGLAAAASPAAAQIAPANDAGVAMGHLHYVVRDVEANTAFWVALGGEAEQVGETVVVAFPDVLVLLDEGESAGNTEGSILNHMAFRVQSLETVAAAGLALMSHIGGASGPLFATIFLELGKAFAEASAPPAESFASGLERAARQIQRLGRAAPGDKTLLDALLPAAEAARNATESLDRAQAAAAEAARAGAEASAGMEARRGRARFIEGSGVGHPDPGAVSVALILESWRGER